MYLESLLERGLFKRFGCESVTYAGPKANLEGNSLEFEVEDGFVGSE